MKGVMKVGNKSHKKAYRSAPSTDVTGRSKSHWKWTISNQSQISYNESRSPCVKSLWSFWFCHVIKKQELCNMPGGV